MEDDNGLELSLAPPSAGDANTTKGKIGSASDSRSDISDRDTRLINEFKQFLDGGNMHIHSGMVSQRVDASKPENFFNNISNTDVETSKNVRSRAFWTVNDRSAEAEENRTDTREKRKNIFGETSQQKMHEKESDHSDLHDKPRVSYISINTDDGSAAENEDVADSEAEASTSKRQQLQQDEVADRYVGSVLSEARKDFHGISESSAEEIAGQKKFRFSSETEFKITSLPHSVQFPAQPVNIVNLSQPVPVKDSNSSSIPIRSSYSLPSMMHVIAATSGGDRTGSQLFMPANVPLVANYSSTKLPSLDKDNSRIAGSHQQMHPFFMSRVPSNSDMCSDSLKMTQVIPQKLSDSKQHEGKASDHDIGNGQPLATGGTSLTEDDAKGSNASSRSKDAPELPKTEGFPSEYPAIKPGIAADLKFGGCGSYPNLPWVSTTSPGPNGRTISGVTYKYSPTQIKIVCACHGLHMSPEEFVGHAREEPSSPDTRTGVLPTSNPATSAQS